MKEEGWNPTGSSAMNVSDLDEYSRGLVKEADLAI